jgi:hypothetical protein
MSSYKELDFDVDLLSMDGTDAPGTKRREVIQLKLNPTETIIRVLPSFTSDEKLLTSGERVPIFREFAIHWGFVDASGKNRPLVCTRDIDRFCPICQEAYGIFNRMKEISLPFVDANGMVQLNNAPKDVGDKYRELKSQYDQINRRVRHYYNVVSPNQTKSTGKNGKDVPPFTVMLGALPKTVSEDIRRKLGYANKNLKIANPVSLKDGVSFKVTRHQTGPQPQNVKYEVDFVKEAKQTEYGMVEVVIHDALPDSIVNNYENLAYDIGKLYPYRAPAVLSEIMQGKWPEEKAPKGSSQRAQAQALETLPHLAPPNVGEVRTGVPSDNFAEFLKVVS